MWQPRVVEPSCLAACRIFCVFYVTEWIVDLYHQHWKCMWPLLSCFVPHWVGNWSVEMRWWWVFLREPEDCIPRPPSVPPWDLEVVLRTLSQLSLEPLASVNMKDLSLKCALLLALALAKHIGDFHAFSMDSDCIHFGPGGCSVTLRPRPGYVPNNYLPIYPLLNANNFAVCLYFWVIDFMWFGGSNFVRPAFDNLTIFSCATVVVRRAGPYQNRGFPIGLWTLLWLLIRGKVWHAPFTLGTTQQGLSPPPGCGREVCLFRIYTLQTAGLLRIPPPGFTSWTFSPWPPQ